MKREEKSELVAGLHEKLEKACGTFLVDYQGLNVESITALRSQLRKADIEFKVVKNRLLKLASQETDTWLIRDHMTGPSAIAVTNEDVVAPAKILVSFAKEHKQMEIKGGQITGQVLDAGAIKRLAELPGRDQLLAQVLSVMNAVPTSLVMVLNGVIVKLLNVLKAIEQQKA